MSRRGRTHTREYYSDVKGGTNDTNVLSKRRPRIVGIYLHEMSRVGRSRGKRQICVASGWAEGQGKDRHG